MIGNTVTDSGETGIEVSNVNIARIRDNNVTRSNEDGISLFGFDTGRIRNNTVNRSGDDGIEVSNGLDALIRGNDVDRSRNDGISVFGITDRFISTWYESEEGPFEISGYSELSVIPSRLRVINNTVDRSGDDGIDIAFAQHVEVRGNDVNRSGFGERVREDIDGPRILEMGELGRDTSNGIIVNNGRGFLVKSLRIDGPAFAETSDVTIVNNRVRNSENSGIAVSGYDEADILDNRVRNSGDNGLYVFGPRNGTINVEGNIFTDNDIGAHFESGLIDLTGVGNEFINGRVGLRFAPYQPPVFEGGDGEVAPARIDSDFFAISPLELVDNDGPGSSPPSAIVPTNFGGTIGEQLFDGQTLYFVELANGAFFDPGAPTWINALNSTYRMGDGTLFRPSTTNGVLNAEQFAFLESRFFHFLDDASLGRFFFGFIPAINQEDIFNQFDQAAIAAGNIRVTILGLPRVSGGTSVTGPAANIAGLLNNLTPFAGGEGNNAPQDVSSLTPEMLDQIETAAGGNATGTEGSGGTTSGSFANTSCWSDAVVGAQQGQVTSFTFGGQLGMADVDSNNNCATQ